MQFEYHKLFIYGEVGCGVFWLPCPHQSQLSLDLVLTDPPLSTHAALLPTTNQPTQSPQYSSHWAMKHRSPDPDTVTRPQWRGGCSKMRITHSCRFQHVDYPQVALTIWLLWPQCRHLGCEPKNRLTNSTGIVLSKISLQMCFQQIWQPGGHLESDQDHLDKRTSGCPRAVFLNLGVATPLGVA